MPSTTWTRPCLSLALAGATLSLWACQGPTPSGGGPAGTLPAAGEARIGEVPAPDLSVAAFSVQTVPLAGGATFADLQKDTDPYDAFKPEVPVRVSAPGFAADAAATNGVMRVRGKSTRDTEQKSFRIELGKAATPWQGFSDLLLNKHPYDFSRLRNRLSFELFRGLKDLPAVPQVGFATLAVDGQNLGFFTRIERLDKAFLKRHGLDEQGWLYKAENFEFLRYAEDLKPSSDPSYAKANFEKHLEIQGNKDHAPLLAMLEALNNPAVPTTKVLADHFDLDNYLTWFAVNVLTDNTDTNSQNFYLYRSTGDARWRFIPWDFDGAWGFYSPTADRSGREGPLGRSHEGAANWWNMTLHRRVLREPHLRAALQARMQQLAEAFFTPARLQSQLDAYRPVVRPAILLAPDAEGFDGQNAGSAFDRELASILQVVPQAQARWAASLKRPMPFFLGEKPERSGGEVAFTWDPSEGLSGQSLSYTLIVAKDPSLKQEVLRREGLSATEAKVPLAPGSYFWSVEAHQADGEWQIPFDAYQEPGSGTPHQGVLKLELP